MTEKLNILKRSRAAVMLSFCYSLPRHVNWSQLQMGPVWYTSKKAVRYTLQDKGDSTKGIKTHPNW